MKGGQPVRALMDHQAFVMQAHGGVSRIFVEVAKHFPSTEMDLTVFGGVHVNKYFQSLHGVETVHSVGLQISRYLGKLRILLPCNNRLLSLYFSLYHPNLIHFTYFYRTQPRRAHVREIITVHDMTYELFPEYYKPTDPTPGLKRRMAQEVDGIICISENTKADLLRLCNVPEDRVRVIPHGNPMEGVVSVRPEARTAPFILFVGRRSGYKDFSMLLYALAGSALCSGWEIVAFGGGPFSAAEHNEIRKCGLSGRVFHLSGSDETLSGHYETAKALVYPSRYEGFGLPPLEAMSRGCPVIVARCSSLPEVVGDAGLYFSPGEAAELRLRIESLLDPGIRAGLAERGRKRAQLFSWERSARMTAEFYREIVARPPRGA